jgi:hypothetical protein
MQNCSHLHQVQGHQKDVEVKIVVTSGWVNGSDLEGDKSREYLGCWKCWVPTVCHVWGLMLGVQQWIHQSLYSIRQGNLDLTVQMWCILWGEVPSADLCGCRTFGSLNLILEDEASLPLRTASWHSSNLCVKESPEEWWIVNIRSWGRLLDQS